MTPRSRKELVDQVFRPIDKSPLEQEQAARNGETFWNLSLCWGRGDRDFAAMKLLIKDVAVLLIKWLSECGVGSVLVSS